MTKFWRAFRPYVWRAVLVPAGVIALDVLVALIRWVAEQIAGEAFLNHFDAWARSHNVSAFLLKAFFLAEANPVAASVILAAVATIYGAACSEYQVRMHPEQFVDVTPASEEPKPSKPEPEKPTGQGVEITFGDIEGRYLDFRDAAFHAALNTGQWTHYGLVLQIKNEPGYRWDPKKPIAEKVCARILLSAAPTTRQKRNYQIPDEVSRIHRGCLAWNKRPIRLDRGGRPQVSNFSRL